MNKNKILTNLLSITKEHEESIRMDIYNYLYVDDKLRATDICKRQNISQYVYNKLLAKMVIENQNTYKRNK